MLVLNLTFRIYPLPACWTGPLRTRNDWQVFFFPSSLPRPKHKASYLPPCCLATATSLITGIVIVFLKISTLKPSTWNLQGNRQRPGCSTSYKLTCNYKQVHSQDKWLWVWELKDWFYIAPKCGVEEERKRERKFYWLYKSQGYQRWEGK